MPMILLMLTAVYFATQAFPHHDAQVISTLFPASKAPDAELRLLCVSASDSAAGRTGHHVSNALASSAPWHPGVG